MGLMVLGLVVVLFAKFIIFKSFERQLQNINAQYADIQKNEIEDDEGEVREPDVDEDFLAIVKTVKLVTYGIGGVISVFGLLMILVFRIFIY